MLDLHLFMVDYAINKTIELAHTRMCAFLCKLEIGSHSNLDPWWTRGPKLRLWRIMPLLIAEAFYRNDYQVKYIDLAYRQCQHSVH